jgi:succinyl-CoA synthetase alpha subunit
MAILADKNTRLIVQGITGREGRFHTRQMVEYGTQVVGGVRPGKGGEWVDGVPVFDTVQNAVDATGANASIIYVPGPGAADAIYESIDAEIGLIVCISDPVPIADMIQVYNYIRHTKSRLIGPNCPGLLTPGQAKIGIIPGYVATPGNVGVVSKSGTLTYEVINALTESGMGQSTCVGIGGDPIVGTTLLEVLELFENDPQTEKIAILGEIGGRAEIDAAEYIRSGKVTKPVAAFIAGRSAPPGTRMGHAGAIVEGGQGSAEEKIEALQAAGVRVADNPEQIPQLLS